MAHALRSSESVEWYTPGFLVDAAREVMGSIELDPASCSEANATVRAERFYTREQDGFHQPWLARTLFLNMPYGRDDADHISNQAKWSHKLLNAVRAGQVEQACMLVNAVPGNRWWRPLWGHPLCFLDGRVRFVAPARTGHRNSPTHSSCIVYMGSRVDRFVSVFSRLGAVVLPSQVSIDRDQKSLLEPE